MPCGGRFCKLMVLCIVRSDYVADYVNVGTTAMEPDQMLSSFHFVRSWDSCGVVSEARKMMTGFVRHAETTDMQVSRLSDPERRRPWINC